MSCIIGGEDAAFVQYSRSGLTEYRFYVLHHPDQQFPYLYEVVILMRRLLFGIFTVTWFGGESSRPSDGGTP